MNKGKSIRKKWLISLLILVSLNFVEFASNLILAHSNLIATEDIYSSAMIAIHSLIIGSLLYHFSYKKQGVGLLTWILFSPLLFIFRLFRSYNSETSTFNSEILEFIPFWGIWDLNFWEGLFIAIPSSILCWWYFLSFKLRKENYKINPKLRKDVRHYISDIKEAVDFNDLDSIYQNSTQKWPGFKDLLSNEYTLKKSELSKISHQEE